MANAPTPPIVPRSPFWALGHRFDRIRSEFYDTYKDIKDIYLLGKWLAWPFFHLSEAFKFSRDITWDADNYVVDIKTWVKGITEGNTFKQLLDFVSYQYERIRNDPRGWVRKYVKEVSDDLSRIISDGGSWFADKLFSRYPVFTAILYASVSWVADKVINKWPQVGGFFSDPISWVRAWVSQLFPFLLAMLASPGIAVTGWLAGRYPFLWTFLTSPSTLVYQWTLIAFPLLPQIVDNPWLWLRLQLATIFQVTGSETHSMPLSFTRRILRVIRENEGSIIETVKQLTCDLIVRYL